MHTQTLLSVATVRSLCMAICALPVGGRAVHKIRAAMANALSGALHARHGRCVWSREAHDEALSRSQLQAAEEGTHREEEDRACGTG